MSSEIPVCSECLQASCWQGIFMCDRAQTASVVYKSRQFLRSLKPRREHPHFWKTDEQLAYANNNLPKKAVVE